jgi:hypothetical protein
MRDRFSIVAVLAALAVGSVGITVWMGGIATATNVPRLVDNSPNAIPVDTELVIAVDVSNSMDPEEQELQREGYIAGLNSREFMQALRQGVNGKVAITYFEWAGLYDQKIILPWRLIDGPETAAAVTNEIARSPYRRAPRTSIFGALQFAKPLFDASGFNGLRRVIDVSGDGVNNMGPSVTLMRDEVLANGITINGLPIMMKRPYGYTSDANLDIYYQDCVIGGPGSFMIAIHERDQFKEATRTKLVQEIAGRTPKQPVIPAQSRSPRIYCS